ncbi:short chain fatty acid transporter [Pseudomonas fluorescens HK44]|uniref:Short chain fatty acid transporter n=1 Tax=Pseudomonas fluorescens HK44 TaxID=1042209 RepID=A0A010REA8_PSEFL|nr:TIGR00366 family protein [Pseudomonas fluorescens]EXF91191.1 short chain fatty acid transporter [Pseudomonas fluorescens HK44]
MDKVADFFTELMRRYMPDPFVFAIGLTLLTMALAVLAQGQSAELVLQSWGDGFWSLLAFTTQMAVILAMGYVLATSPFIDGFLNRIVQRVKRPATAVIVATLVGAIGSYLNWGFGLVIGGIVARKLAIQVRGVHYPLIIAAAYSGFTFYGLGLSSTIPVLISTPGHPLESKMGLIGLTETIFSLPMLLTALCVLITLPLLNAWLHPKHARDVVEIDQALLNDDSPKRASAVDALFADNTFAATLNNSRLLSSVIGLLGMGYLILHFLKGGSLDLNKINFFILFLGILLLGTPKQYIAKLSEGIKTISGIILQFPFYAGIMAIMQSSGLVNSISHSFVGVANAQTLPFWGLISSFVINFFAPSGGGHWAIQGPFMIEAAKSLNSSLAQTSMAVMLGNAWNDLVQPFWILPALALSRLRLKDVMGYTVIMMLWVGLIYIAVVVLWGYLSH